MWEYRQGEVVYELLLDRHGNGPYDWQEGRFETTAVSNGQWKGRWVQLGNDREGGFEAWLAKDGMSARGHSIFGKPKMECRLADGGGIRELEMITTP